MGLFKEFKDIVADAVILTGVCVCVALRQFVSNNYFLILLLVFSSVLEELFFGWCSNCILYINVLFNSLDLRNFVP